MEAFSRKLVGWEQAPPVPASNLLGVSLSER